MNHQYIIKDYGITDPTPVLQRILKAEQRMDRTVSAQVRILERRIAREKRVATAKSFLTKHPKRA